MSMYYQT